MYRVQYLCPRQSPYWQDLTEGLIWKTPKQFVDRLSAEKACNGLLWRYHSARVIDPWGQVVYRI